jgi:hypothetical protein
MSGACSLQCLSGNRTLAITWVPDMPTCECIETGLEGGRTAYSWPVTVSSEHRNENYDFIKDSNFLSYLSNSFSEDRNSIIHLINRLFVYYAIEFVPAPSSDIILCLRLIDVKFGTKRNDGGWHGGRSLLVFYMASGSKATFVEIVIDRLWS